MRREGFDPPEPKGRRVYSAMQLTTLPPAQKIKGIASGDNLIFNKITVIIPLRAKLFALNPLGFDFAPRKIPRHFLTLITEGSLKCRQK